MMFCIFLTLLNTFFFQLILKRLIKIWYNGWLQFLFVFVWERKISLISICNTAWNHGKSSRGEIENDLPKGNAWVRPPGQKSGLARLESTAEWRYLCFGVPLLESSSLDVYFDDFSTYTSASSLPFSSCRLVGSRSPTRQLCSPRSSSNEQVSAHFVSLSRGLWKSGPHLNYICKLTVYNFAWYHAYAVNKKKRQKYFKIKQIQHGRWVVFVWKGVRLNPDTLTWFYMTLTMWQESSRPDCNISSCFPFSSSSLALRSSWAVSGASFQRRDRGTYESVRSTLIPM